jgi:HTH-type transcriptional regulator / antitoxin HigA
MALLDTLTVSEIKDNSYHVSEDSEEVLTIDEKEDEANAFARDYLFSKEKLDNIGLYMNDKEYVKEIAEENNVHSSVIYVFHAFEYGHSDRKAWARARRLSPDIKKAVHRLENDWHDPMPIDDFSKKLKLEIYN